MAFIKLKPPYNVRIQWLEKTGELRSAQTKHVNSVKYPDPEQYDRIYVPSGLNIPLSVSIYGKALQVDIRDLGPESVHSFGNLGKRYSGIKLGNPKLLTVPNVLPESFNTIDEMLAGSTQFDDRNIEEWNTSNITSAKKAFKDCVNLKRNLTCWVVDKISGEPTEIFASTGVPVKRKPRWGQTATDRAGRTGLPCTALDLQVIGSTTTITNQYSLYSAEAEADVEENSLTWEIVPVDEVQLDSVDVNDNTVALRAKGATVVRLRANYDDGKYQSQTFKDVAVVDNIRIDAPPTISSLGCGAMIFITASVSGDLESYEVLWEQVSGTPVEIDNADRLTMGFVRPTTGLSSGAEEFVFRLFLAKGTDLERHLDVRVSGAPTTYVSSINRDFLGGSIRPTFTRGSTATIEPNGRDGGGGLLKVTTPVHQRWLKVLLLEQSGDDWIIYDESIVVGDLEFIVSSTGVYKLVDLYSTSKNKVGDLPIPHEGDRVFQVGYKHGAYLSDLPGKKKSPDLVIHVESDLPVTGLSALSRSPVWRSIYRSEYSRLIESVTDTLTNGDFLLNSPKALTDFIATPHSVEASKNIAAVPSGRLVTISTHISDKKMIRYDINYVAG